MQDLQQLEAICQLLGSVDPYLDYRDIVRELSIEHSKEVDLLTEARNLAEISASLQRACVSVLVPEVTSPFAPVQSHFSTLTSELP